MSDDLRQDLLAATALPALSLDVARACREGLSLRRRRRATALASVLVAAALSGTAVAVGGSEPKRQVDVLAPTPTPTQWPLDSRPGLPCQAKLKYYLDGSDLPGNDDREPLHQGLFTLHRDSPRQLLVTVDTGPGTYQLDVFTVSLKDKGSADVIDPVDDTSSSGRDATVTIPVNGPDGRALPDGRYLLEMTSTLKGCAAAGEGQASEGTFFPVDLVTP
jgi:hypothetical protein